ncbi:MAG: hypothetical protein HYX63_01650 [Gammaproteobacteria bacterium]|nr:hypothetical protein [Gammaproteobacteria bacterium]
MITGDTTQEIDRRIAKDFDRRKGAEEIEQYRFKRRAAYFGMFLMATMLFCSQAAPADLRPHWAAVADTIVWVCGMTILGAIVPEAVGAIAAARGGKL